MSDYVNAKIVSTHLGFEDHGILTFYVTFEADRLSGSIGGYNLIGCGRSGVRAIENILLTAGVDCWEKLKGTVVRLRGWDNPNMSSRDVTMGHLLEDKWFHLKSFMDEAIAKEKETA